jgi:hypothetical protein
MIYIIITTSINNKHGVKNEIHRQNRYIECITKLLSLINDNNMKPIIVENNGLRHTFLNDLNCEVHYTNNNIFDCFHKGENELFDIKEVIDKYQIQDDDTIIKLTGRYKILDLHFINLVKNNIDNYDACVKFFNVCTQQYCFNDCVLGLFSMKCKYLKNFKYNFSKSAECEFAEFVRQNIDKNKIKEVKQLNLECCFADNLRILNV